MRRFQLKKCLIFILLSGGVLNAQSSGQEPEPEIVLPSELPEADYHHRVLEPGPNAPRLSRDRTRRLVSGCKIRTNYYSAISDDWENRELPFSFALPEEDLVFQETRVPDWLIVPRDTIAKVVSTAHEDNRAKLFPSAPTAEETEVRRIYNNHKDAAERVFRNIADGPHGREDKVKRVCDFLKDQEGKASRRYENLVELAKSRQRMTRYRLPFTLLLFYFLFNVAPLSRTWRDIPRATKDSVKRFTKSLLFLKQSDKSTIKERLGLALYNWFLVLLTLWNYSDRANIAMRGVLRKFTHRVWPVPEITWDGWY